MTPRARQRRRLARPRGQNMVLLALAMLFLALMVTVTLGLGMRVRQNHELQNLADSAAYSNAVVTARAFNNSALLNRLEVSYWVSQSADQSLISWTSYSRAMANAAIKAARELKGTSVDMCVANNRRANQVEFQFVRLRTQDFRPNTRYEDLDRKAGLESRGIQLAIAALRDELRPWQDSVNPQNLRKRLFDNVQNQTISRDIITASKVPGVQVVATPASSTTPTGVEGVNRRELDCDFGGVDSAINNDQPPGTGLCMRATWSRTMLDAAMGSRGSPFVTRRGVPPQRMVDRLQQAASRVPGVSLSLPPPQGAGYWSGALTHGAAPIGTDAWGDDHGSLSLTVDGPGNTCSGTSNQDIKAHVMSTHIDDDTDVHEIEPNTLGDGEGDDAEAPIYHTMASCQPLCPSVWVRTLGFQPRDSAGDAWGQPKHLVAIQRDNSVQKFPWELHFKFPFSATGPAREWDGRGEVLAGGAAAGLNVTRSVAMATGMTYYHRREHWDEFPNQLNPFWRATLVPVDVDAQAGGGADTAAALADSKFRWQREAYQSLVGAGYRGLH